MIAEIWFSPAPLATYFPSLPCLVSLCNCKVSCFREMAHWKMFHVLYIKDSYFEWIYFPPHQVCWSWTYSNVFSGLSITAVVWVCGEQDLPFWQDTVPPGLLVQNGLARHCELKPWILHVDSNDCLDSIAWFLWLSHRIFSLFLSSSPYQYFLYYCLRVFSTEVLGCSYYSKHNNSLNTL